MSDTFQLPVLHQGTELLFDTRMEAWRYGRRFYVTVGDATILFEEDEEKNIRAILPEGETGKTPNRYLIESISHSVEELCRD
jgi:hypothetical protein